MMKNLLILLLALFFLTSCSLHVKPKTFSISPKENLVYHGFLPCKTCTKKQIWLLLNQEKNGTFYTLIQEDKGGENRLFQTHGQAKWLDNSHLNLPTEQKTLFLDKKYALLLPYQKAKLDKKYALEKLDQFQDEEKTLFVKPSTLRQGNQGKHYLLTFDGIMNFYALRQGGHRSLEATFIVYCTSKRYEMPKITYYKNSFATQDILATSSNSPHFLLYVQGDVIYDVATFYCPKN